MREITEPFGSDEPVRHPISVASAQTGLSRDVIRVWERRYRAVEPMRSSGGQRVYSEEDIERLRLLAAATKHGRNISMVARLGTEQLVRLAKEDQSKQPQVEFDSESSTATDVDVALVHIIQLDGASLDAQLRRAIRRSGEPWFLEQLAPALMRAVGDGWATGALSIAHEHLTSAVVIAILLETVRAVPSVSSAPKLVVATPSGDRHAIGAALVAAAASIEGWSIVYLGADVPAADISAAAASIHARAVALSVVYAEDRERVLAELRSVRAQLGARVHFLVGGAAGALLAEEFRSDRVTFCGSLRDVRAEFRRIA